MSDETAAIKRLRDGGQWRQALERATAALKSREVSHSDKVAILQEHFLDADCLIWACGRHACGPSGTREHARECQAAVQKFYNHQTGELDSTIRDFLTREIGLKSVAQVRGIVRTVQAAAADVLDSPAVDRYRTEAVGAFQDVFAVYGDPGLGDALLSSIVSNLRNGLRVESDRRAETWVLLEGPEAQAVKLVVELLPGQTGRMLPDPMPLGLTLLDDVFLKSIADAWVYVTSRWPCPAGLHAIWRIEGLRGERQVGGASGGAATAAAFRSAIEGVRLDPFVAITARIQSDGGLGDVIGAVAKRGAAAKVQCDLVLFEPRTAKGVLNIANVPRVIGVKTFDDAWIHLTGRMRVLEDYLAAERKAIRSRLRFEPLGVPSQDSPSSATSIEAILERLNVPLRVTRVEKVDLPPNENAALLEERDGFLGRDRPRRSGAEREDGPAPTPSRGDRLERRRARFSIRRNLYEIAQDESQVPPWSVERLPEEQIRPFDEVFREWSTTWSGTCQPLVILGDPGYGKSWLTWLWTLRLFDRLWGLLTNAGTPDASSEGKELLPNAAPPLLPLRVSCRNLGMALARAGNALPRAVERIVVAQLKRDGAVDDQRLRVFRQLVREWFNQGRVLVIADGWDERNPDHSEALIAAFQSWAGLRHPLVVTSRLVGYPAKGLIKEAAEWRLTTLEVPEGINKLVRAYFGASEAKARALLEQLGQRPHLQHLLRVPLMGSLVCRMWQEGRMPPVPEERTRLLRQAIEMLLIEGYQEFTGLPASKMKPGANPPTVLTAEVERIAEDVLLVLARLAYRTFMGERWIISRTQLRKALKRLPREAAKLGDLDAIEDALTGRFGLFTAAPRGKLEVLHQSFGEFLCAWWVARFYGKDRGRFTAWMRTHGGIRFLDPRWNEVWCHVAGLLTTLKDERAAEEPKRCDATPLIDELWLMHRRSSGWRRLLPGPKDDLFHSALRLACACLATAGPDSIRKSGAFSLKHLVSLLRRENHDVFGAAIEALGRIGPKVVPHLISLLDDSKPHVRGRAADVLGRIGAGAAAVPHLIPLLTDDHSDVRVCAAEALGRIGAGATAAVPYLIALISDYEWIVRVNAAVALGRIGAGEAAVPHLISLLAGNRPHLRSIATDALGKVGAGAAAVPHLISLMNDEDWEVAENSAEALRRIGTAAVPHLIALLADNQLDVRRRAAQALGGVGAGAATAVPDLISLLDDNQPHVREAAAQALGRVGAGASAVPHLIARIADYDHNVRGHACDALTVIGTAAVPHLLPVLADDHTYVRSRAAKALGVIGAAAVPYLIPLLADNQLHVRGSAAAALGQIGPGAAAAVPDLTSLLAAHDPDVRWEAVQALGRIGAGAAAAVPHLVALLPVGHPSLRSPLESRTLTSLRWNTIETLGRIGAGAAAAVPHLIPLLVVDWDVWDSAARALGRIGAGAAAVPYVLKQLADDHPGVWTAAAAALGEIGAEAVPPLTQLLAADSWKVRLHAADALGRVGAGAAAAALPHLVPLLIDNHSEVRRTAADTLRALAPAAGFVVFRRGFHKLETRPLAKPIR